MSEPEVFNDAFAALFPQEEAENLRVRASLMVAVRDHIRRHGWTQRQAAEVCGLTAPRMSDLMNGRIAKFSLDALVKIAASLRTIRITVTDTELTPAD